jgi:uncharacterized protein
MSDRKSDRESPIVPPIDFHPPSNGEFSPLPPGKRARLAHELWSRIVEEKHHRLGMTRRQFAESACGLAAALYVLNACGSSDETGSTAAGGTGGRGGSGGSGGSGGGAGSAGVGGSGGGGFDASADALEDSASYDVTPDMLEDVDAARDRLTGNEFIFDVQTHVSTPLTPWTEKTPPERALDFIKQIFVQSDTTVACLSGVPATRDLGISNVEGNAQIEEIIGRLGGPRLIMHANADPELGPSELDYMSSVTSRFTIGAFKVYPHRQARRLDSDEVGGPFIEQAHRLGVRVIAAHRGISGGGGYEVAGSPVDVVRAAKKFPAVNFLIYHSGWEPGGSENHPFDANQANPTGIDRLIKALIDNGIGPNSNVYAELGSTWANLMVTPADAGHALGKLLRYVGQDRVLYGTDSVFNGVPQSQIAALRTFTIPQSLQDQYGYPALTPAVRAKIFGLNAVTVYGVDPAAVRYVIRNDDVERLRVAFREDPRSVPMPNRHEYVGPRTRREFLTLLARGDHPKIG